MFLTKSKKSPYYQLVYEVNGKRTTVSTKTKIKSEAVNFLRQFNLEEKTEQNIHQISLQSFRKEYIEYCSQNKSKKYVKGSIKTTFNMLTDEFGNPNLKDFTVRQLDKFISNKYKDSPYSAILIYRVTKAAFNKAKNWGYMTDNPLMSLKIPKVPKKIPIFITRDELEQIINHIENIKIRRICEFAFLTGMRLSEITHLTWDCIDNQNKIITVKNNNIFTTKNKTDRIVPMCGRVEEIIHAEKSIHNKFPSDLVFYKLAGIKYNSDYISKVFKSGVKKTNLNQRIHFHTLRHSFASTLVSKGVSLFIIKELLGHSDFSTTQIYAHLEQKSLMNAVKVFDN